MIEVDSLRKDYGPIRALKSVSFEIKKSEVVGFLGPNGAGKSTCMRILTGSIHQSSGSARIAGHCVLNDTTNAQRRIGYLPESAPLYDDMYIFEYLSFVADIRGLRGPARAQRIRHAMELCQIGQVADRLIGQLSKGFRQRVGLAQAFLHDPDVIILDEPTTGLDPIQIAEICKTIRELGKEKTIVFSSHILSEVEATCSRALIIHNGVIVADEKLGKLRDARSVIVGMGGKKDRVIDALSALPGVGKVASLGQQRYEVIGGDAEKLPGKIYNLAKEKEWGLNELRVESRKLEDLFFSLTKD